MECQEVFEHACCNIRSLVVIFRQLGQLDEQFQPRARRTLDRIENRIFCPLVWIICDLTFTDFKWDRTFDPNLDLPLVLAPISGGGYIRETGMRFSRTISIKESTCYLDWVCHVMILRNSKLLDLDPS